MTWRKYFKIANQSGNLSPINGANSSTVSLRNYQSSLPEVYTGHPNRVDRYNQYEQMDMDPEVNAALDILAEFSTQTNVENGTAFQIFWKETPSDNEVKIIKEQLNQWTSVNELNKRIFKLFRNTIKYGDQVLIRDPETFKLLWVEMSKVVKVIVNESDGKKPEQYVLKEIAPNLQNLTATQVATSDTYINHPQVGGPSGAYTQPMQPYAGGSRFSNAQNETPINAEHIVHLSLTEGLDVNWPFGNSVLENVFKVFKQKELIEDAIIIYRIQRAPERRMFYIDVGSMPSHLAMAFVERIKNEVSQRRIPTQTGGGANFQDSTYNPLSVQEDYFFPQCLSLDTKIKLLDDRDLTLDEIINEYESGKENFVYSVNPKTKEIEPGKIVWAGVTRKNARVVRVTLDNDESVICTPDHPFIMRDGSEVEAQHLEIANEIMSLDASICVALIEWLTETIDTGDITVESPSNAHNFALSIGIFVHNSPEGRGTKVEVLPGGQNLGEITDLHFFTNKLFRGLRIPASYLPTGMDDGQAAGYNDGKVGVALIQEWRFNQYCQRLQRLVVEKLDQEFKMFMRWRGVNIDNSVFDLRFNEPQNFASYRQAEVDSARIACFSQLEQVPYMSKRFLMKRYLGLTEDEVAENHIMWAEEQGDGEMASDGGEGGVGLRSVGITPSGIEDDMAGAEMPMAGEMPPPEEIAAPNAPPQAGAGAPGAAPPTV